MVSISLGTAQFGLDYGITNSSGKVDPVIVPQLLEFAHRNQVQYLDTASAYGCAESILGKSLPSNHSFSIISKLPPQPSDLSFTTLSQNSWQSCLESTLSRLNVSHLDSFLLHNSSDLKRPDSHILLNWLKSIQKAGLVDRIGVSIYTRSDLLDLPLSDFQIIQLPCSLYDQRLLFDGTISHILKHGIAIHARSLFLQGLLVTPHELWPNNITPAFRLHHQQFQAWAESIGSTLPLLAISWARNQSWLEAAVVGVTNFPELSELITCWSSPNPWFGHDSSIWAWHHKSDVDPRFWV